MIVADTIKEYVMKKISLYLLILSSIFFIGCGGGSSSSITGSVDASTKCISNEGGICVIASTGDSTDDALLRAVHADTMSFFEFNTKFYIFQEDSPAKANAFASESDRIYFGNYLFGMLRSASKSDYPTMVKGIMAHEYGHVVQNHTFVNTANLAAKRQAVDVGSTVILSELEADAFSGLYMYFELKNEKQIELYFQLLNSLGSNNFTSPDFHGTGAQRQAAAAYGILMVDYIIENNLIDYVNWADIRVEFIRGIATYILNDVNYRQAKESNPYGFSQENLDIVRGIAKGENSISDLKL